MAFWDDMDFEIDWEIAGWVLVIWAIAFAILIKAPFLFGSMDAIKLFGMPWNVARIVIGLLALPIGYYMTIILLNRQG